MTRRACTMPDIKKPVSNGCNMITIASLLKTKTVGLRTPKTRYAPGFYGAFDGDKFIAAYPSDTPLDVALASAEYENNGSSEALRALLTLEARDGNEEAAEWLRKNPA